jgi:hypothetical protein
MSIEYLGGSSFVIILERSVLERVTSFHVFLHLTGEHFLAFLWHWEREVYKLRTVVDVVLFVESLRRSG